MKKALGFSPRAFQLEKHLHRYVAESAWRFNLRQIGEGQRVNAIMTDANGHLRYKDLIA